MAESGQCPAAPSRSRGGVVQFSGKDISRLEPEEKVKMGMAYIPQGKNIFPSLTVRENLEMGGTPLIEPSLIKKAIQEVSERFPMLERRFKTKAGALSGGEKQVLALARASMLKPKLILLDEPSLGLAPKVIEETYASIHSINKE
ncbi:MAG: ATP-binding cassette domain-containing protein [Thermodesulfobacteriota bacterium]